jgi:predicted SAM-dependent methyltransferase
VRSAELVNLGCGGNILKGFVNVDYGWRKGVVCWDMRKPLPFASDSVSGIFCEHALEHFEWKDALYSVLPEMFRILKPGGNVRIAVPDAEMIIDEYVRARDAGECETELPAHADKNRLCLTPMAIVNNGFRRIYEPYYMGHKFMYDFQTMKQFLTLSGFGDIQRASFMQGRDPRLLVDYAKRKDESLYVEATKP